MESRPTLAARWQGRRGQRIASATVSMPAAVTGAARGVADRALARNQLTAGALVERRRRARPGRAGSPRLNATPRLAPGRGERAPPDAWPVPRRSAPAPLGAAVLALGLGVPPARAIARARSRRLSHRRMTTGCVAPRLGPSIAALVRVARNLRWAEPLDTVAALASLATIGAVALLAALAQGAGPAVRSRRIGVTLATASITAAGRIVRAVAWREAPVRRGAAQGSAADQVERVRAVDRHPRRSVLDARRARQDGGAAAGPADAPVRRWIARGLTPVSRASLPRRRVAPHRDAAHSLKYF